MSRGLGKTQRAILAALPDSGSMTVAALARQLGAPQRQIRAAVHALADRELVMLDLWSSGERAGVGEYGPLVQRIDGYWNPDNKGPARLPYGPDVPTAEVRKRWVNDCDDDGNLIRTQISIEYVHAGMPTGRSLFVWSLAAWQADQQRLEAFRAVRTPSLEGDPPGPCPLPGG